MSAPKNMRGLFLRIVLKNQKLEEDFGVKVINNFRIGTNLFDTMVGTGAAHEKMCSTIFDKIWTRGIVKFSKIIRELQVLYCKDQKRTKHLPWLDGISLNESKILEELLAHKVGK
jgi:hypothetical protein